MTPNPMGFILLFLFETKLKNWGMVEFIPPPPQVASSMYSISVCIVLFSITVTVFKIFMFDIAIYPTVFGFQVSYVLSSEDTL